MANNKNTMLPGFQLHIADVVEEAIKVPNIEDVYTIFSILPERMKSLDEFGEEEEVYIEPNKPLMITSPDEAVQTLENTSLVLTREVKNIIRLIPDGSSIALVRIVKRNGDDPNPNSLTDMYEALDFAFENTENFPSREVILANISLDDMVALDPNKIQLTENKNHFEGFRELIKSVSPYNNNIGIISDKKFTLNLIGTKSEKSSGETSDGVHDTFELMLNEGTAEIITEDGLKKFKLSAELEYSGSEGEKTYSVSNQNNDIQDYAILKIDNSILKLEIKKDLLIKLDDETVVKIQSGLINVASSNKEKTTVSSEYEVVKLSDDASILRRTLLHTHKITSEQNNAYFFASPTPPKSLSNRDIETFTDRCLNLYEKIREQSVISDRNGRRIDLGRYLSVPVGVNQLDGLGGLVGFPQAKVAMIEDKKVTTKKATSAFSVGDIAEVYTYNKMDILVHQSKVTKVSISDDNTVEITLEESVPSEITTGLQPKYIQNVNNKDFSGNYLARQWSNICKQAGVNRSPAGLYWRGSCQLRFSESQLQKLDSRKFCTLQKIHGQNIGSVSRSQLMTDTSNVFQDIETLTAVYTLVGGSKKVVMPYRGLRIDDATDLALIKTQLEDTVFKPAVNEFITPDYDLGLKLATLTNPNGKREKTLLMNFTVREIGTLKLIRMSAKILTF